MYEELVERLREYAAARKGEIAELTTEAAEAIKTLCATVAEAYSEMACMEEEKPQWIPVTERLPEDIDEEVLVCTEDYGVNCFWFVTTAIYDNSGWLECWNRRAYIIDVTHWMPLPEPPKEET